MLSQFVKKLMFARQFSMEDGKIEMLGSREVMLPVNFVASFDKSIYAQAKKASVGMLQKLAKKLGLKGPTLMNTAIQIYDSYGLGKMIIKTMNGSKSALVEVKESPIVAELRMRGEKPKAPACFLTAGVLAGTMSVILSKDMDAKEIRCAAKGDGVCQFEVR